VPPLQLDPGYAIIVFVCKKSVSSRQTSVSEILSAHVSAVCLVSRNV